MVKGGLQGLVIPPFLFIDFSLEKVKIRLDTIAKRGEKVRKNNKIFVRNLIIASIVGLVALMIGLFIILQIYLGNNRGAAPYSESESSETLEPTVELSENLVVLVEDITEKHIIGFDVHNKQIFNKMINDHVKVSDAYGNVLPIKEIKVGDIIEVDYQSEKDKVIAISKSASMQNWKKISGVTVDTEAKKVNVGGTSYAYMDETLVINADGTKSEMDKLTPFDVVSIQAIDDVIWSITIDQKAASLNLSELPTSNGQIEIDNSRLLPFKSVREPIPLIAGRHKIVVRMKGYIPISQEITVEPGETYQLSLKDAEIAYTTIRPYLPSKVTDYVIAVGDKVYKPGEEIKVQQGEYRITVTAEGYQKWTGGVSLDKDVYQLSVPLVEIKKEKDEDEKASVADGSSTTANNEAGLNNSRTITINSEPSGANVYIDGAFKGTTPYSITLKDGTYGILLEKTDYDVYSTNILLDGSNDQSSFLYQLVPKSNQ